VSGDGQVALVGEASLDFYTNVGRAWLYEASSSGVWPASGEKLVGSDSSMPSPDPQGGQGWSVALSGAGNTAIIGAQQDGGGEGAFWIFIRDTQGWVSIDAPCPELYLLNNGYTFTAVVNFNPGKATPTFSWSLSPNDVAQISGPTTDSHVGVDMKILNPKRVFGPGPFVVNLCVDATIAGNVVHECIPLKIYRPAKGVAMLAGILSLNCMVIEPVRNKPPGFVDRWSGGRPVRTYTQAELASIESIANRLAADARAAKAEAGKKGTRTASAAK
jgi:hypothetical protein